jgi:hypothetical protein
MPQRDIDAWNQQLFERLMRFRWRWQQMSLVAIIVFWGLFKLNLLSPGWNIVAGLAITTVLFVLTGFVRND